MNHVKVIIPRNETVVVDKDNNVLCGEALAEGERLVDVGRFNDFVKPLYDESTGDFIESATPEEIAAARPTPPQATQLTDSERIAFLEDAINVILGGL